MHIVHSELLELLHYSLISGEFTWLCNRTGGTLLGDRAGTEHKQGYRIISVNSYDYPAQRLAWFYVTGDWPPATVDHTDNNRLNNTWLNLRLASKGQNNRNRKTPITNTSGYKGVSLRADGSYVASCAFEGKRTFLGYHKTPELAKAARDEFAKFHHGEFYRS
jgi:hypothetical protein